MTVLLRLALVLLALAAGTLAFLVGAAATFVLLLSLALLRRLRA